MNKINNGPMGDHNYFKILNSFEKNKDIETKLIIGNRTNRTKPFFSIIIPTYKRPELLREAISSALNQSFQGNYEIIIVDDEVNLNKESLTEKVVTSLYSKNVFYYRNNENLGQHGNWNRCYEIAKGDWVCMLHDDDKLTTNYLGDLYKVIQSEPKIGFISCRIQLLIQNDANTAINSHLKIKRYTRAKLDGVFPEITKISDSDFLFGFKLYIVGSCIKRELVINLGGFDSTYFPSSDYYFVVHFQNKFNNVYFLKKKNYVYRIFNNESLNPITFGKFITNDYFFTKFLIRVNKYKYSKLLFFLNNQYAIQRVLNGGKLYDVKLDLNKILCELNIQTFQKLFIIRIVGKFLLGLLSIYRNIIKY